MKTNVQNSRVSTLPMVRMDRNVIQNLDCLFDNYNIKDNSIDDNLLRSMIVYLCYQYQKDLFNYCIFDPYDFAKEMQYSRSHLFTKHPSPLFPQDLKKESVEYKRRHIEGGLPIYDNNIENALYILNNKDIIFQLGALFYNKTEREERVAVHQRTSMRIIETLKTETITSRSGHQKKVYSLTLIGKFVHSLIKYFIRINKDTMIKLRRSRLDILYEKLVQYKNTALFKGASDVRLSFNTLCSWCCLPLVRKDGREIAAKKRKQWVLDALSKVNEISYPELDYDVECIADREQKYKYTFVLKFQHINEFLEQKKAADTNDIHSLFYETLGHDLAAFYRTAVCGQQNPLYIEPEEFRKWMRTDCDYADKQRIYMLVCRKIIDTDKKISEEKQRDNERKRLIAFDEFYKMALQGNGCNTAIDFLFDNSTVSKLYQHSDDIDDAEESR